MSAATARGPRPQRPQTRARAKALVRDELRLELLAEATRMRRALDGVRTLLVAGAELDAETTGRILGSCSGFVDAIAVYLGGR